MDMQSVIGGQWPITWPVPDIVLFGWPVSDIIGWDRTGLVAKQFTPAMKKFLKKMLPTSH